MAFSPFTQISLNCYHTMGSSEAFLAAILSNVFFNVQLWVDSGMDKIPLNSSKTEFLILGLKFS